MEEKAFIELKNLINSLSENEARVLEQYLLAFEKKNREFTPLTLLLFQCIYYNRYNCVTTYKKIYSSENHKNFKVLCYRLRDKILESFLLGVNVNRPDFISKFGKTEIKTKKMLMQTKLCFTKGQSALALTLLDKIIAKGKKNELYPELIEALHLKRRAYNLRYGSHKYKQLKEEIQYHEGCRDAIFEAMEYQNHLQSEAAFSNSITKKLKTFISYITNLEALYKEYSSPTLLYHLLWVKMDYNQYNRRFELSNDYCDQMLNLITNKEHLYKKIRKSSIVANKALNMVFCGEYAKAFVDVKEAEQYFTKGSFNYTTLL